MLMPDREQAKAFLNLLDPAATSFTFQTFTDSKQTRAQQARGKLPGDPLAQVLHGSLDDRWDALVALNRKGAGVYVTVNATDGKGRKLGNIAAIRGVWREADASNLPALPLAPSVVVESSPGKHHEYILTDAALPLAPEFESVMAEMVASYGSDPNAKDRARVLRLPGFFHLKDGKVPTLVRIVQAGLRYHWSAIVKAFCTEAGTTSIQPRNRIQGKPPSGAAGIQSNLDSGSSARAVPRVWFEDRPRVARLRTMHAIDFLCMVKIDGGLWVDKRENWLKLGMALHASCTNDPAALNAWKYWSKRSSTWLEDALVAEAECDRKWVSFKNYTGVPVTLGSIMREARLAGWNPALMLSAAPHFRLKTIAEVLQQRPPQWVIHEVLQANSLTVLFGSANSGKSFLALDMALAITRGTDWFGRKVRHGAVVYIAIEGPQRNRLAAYLKHHKIARPPNDFRLVDVPLNLCDRPPKATDSQQLIEAIQDQLGNSLITAVIIDTLNQALQGGDENSSEDMGAFIANANAFRTALGCAVLVVHHAGKDRDRGARGHSSLKGAVDTELEVIYDKGSSVRIASITKQRDGSDDLQLPYILKVIDLGPNPNDPNDKMTSCVVVPPPLTMAVPMRGRSSPKGRNQKIVFDEFREMMKTTALPVGPGIPAVFEDDLLKSAAKSLPLPAGALDRRRQQAREAIDGLCGSRWLIRFEDEGRRFIGVGSAGRGLAPSPFVMPEMTETPDLV